LVDTIWFELKCENNRWWRCSPKKSIWALYKGASDTRNWKVREHQGTISKCLCLGKDLMHCHALPKLDKLYRIVIYASLIFFIFDSIWFYLILFDSICVFNSLCSFAFRVFAGQDLRAGAHIWHDWVAVELVWFKDLANASETNDKSSKGSWAKWLSLVHTSHEMALW
jgi:hypothetical protein